MADNDPVQPQLEVESVLHHSNETQGTSGGPDIVVTAGEEQVERPINTSSAEEPKADLSAPEQTSGPKGDETGEGIVATIAEQAANPNPSGEGTLNTGEGQTPSLATESTSNGGLAVASPAPTKRFTSMNINKKFLAKTAAASPNSSSSATTPKAPAPGSTARPVTLSPAAPSRLITKKLTTTAPAPSASGGWSVRPTPPASSSTSPAPGEATSAQVPPSVKPTGSADVLKRPSLVSSTSALSIDSRASAKDSREHSPVKAWASVPAPTSDLGRNLQEFPTAAEAAADHPEGKRVGPSASEADHSTADTSTHTAEGDTRDSFRGVHLDPKAHHWDDMEDESNDFLGEVIDFGDGKTYTVPPEDDEPHSSPTLNKETRLGDDYDRSWPRSRPLHHEAEPSHSVASASQHSRFPPSHGLPPRHPPGDGRVLFNERSNRLEPARLQTSSHILAPGGPLHHHGPPPHPNGPPRPAARRNSALTSDRPKPGSVREPPPHSRDLPPHAVPGLSPELRARRPSDARSAHSPIERRSSFLHDERPRMGPFASKGYSGDEPASGLHGLRRETSRDSRVGGGERQPWGIAHQYPPNHRAATDTFHPRDALEPSRPHNEPAPTSLDKPAHMPNDDPTTKAHLSPSQPTSALPTAPLPHGSLSPDAPIPAEAPTLPLVPAVLNEEREKFMKQAAERARRRKMEEEAAREEVRERARKKAAELEALSKASLVTASPLVALTRQVSNSYSSGARSPVPKSPSVAPSVLPPSSVTSDAPSKSHAPLESASIAATVTSWRAKPKPDPIAATVPSETLSPKPSHVSSPPAVRVEPDLQPQAPVPPTATLGGGGMHAIEELHQLEGPLEVMDFSDMSKLAGGRTSITSASDLSRRKRPVASDYFDEASSTQPTQRPNQGYSNYTHWNRDNRAEKPLGDATDERTRTPASSSARPLATGPSMSSMHPRSSFKEAPISALDDVMSRIKGVLTGMHADGDKPATSAASAPPSAKVDNIPPSAPTPASAPIPVPAPVPTASAPLRTNSGVGPRWKGDGITNWRDGANKKLPSGRPIEARATEPFATTRPERPDTPPAAGKALTVHLNKSTGTRPPMPKRQATLAKLPPMPVRWDILTWDPPVERMSTWTLSRDDMLFPRTILHGVLATRVYLPSIDPVTGAQSVKPNDSPVQRARLTAVVDSKPSRSPNVPTRPIPKGPAFSEGQWRKPHTPTSPLRNTLELQNHVSPITVLAGEQNQLETTSRSPPPHHLPLSGAAAGNEAAVSPPSPTRGGSKQQWGTDVAFHRSLSEKRPSAMASVSFTVSSELDDPPTAEAEATVQAPDVEPPLEDNALPSAEPETTATGNSEQVNGGVAEDKLEQVASGEKTTSPTPNSSVLLTPPVKVTTPWQASTSRLPDTDYLKSVWQHASPKENTNTENSLRGIVDDFPSAIPHSVQEMKLEDGEPKPSREPTASAPIRTPHNAHRAFQQVPSSPAPMHMSGYPHHPAPNQAGPSRPIPMPSFSLPPPAPPQVTSQPSPYSPYVHPTPPTLMYTIPPSRIAPSPAPGPQMWVQGQAYGRPSPPAGMYPAQHGHNMAYPSPASQMPPPMSKPQGGINGNHGHHPMSSPAMTHPMHMGSPAMSHVGHMGSPALGHATVHMPGGPQPMYPGMNSPGGMGMGPNMPYGAQRPTPTMMQQSPMQAPLPNGYSMAPGGAYPPAGYGRGVIRSPADNMPHHMSVPHLQHAPMSPGTYHPNAYARPW